MLHPVRHHSLIIFGVFIKDQFIPDLPPSTQAPVPSPSSSVSFPLADIHEDDNVFVVLASGETPRGYNKDIAGKITGQSFLHPTIVNSLTPSRSHSHQDYYFWKEEV